MKPVDECSRIGGNPLKEVGEVRHPQQTKHGQAVEVECVQKCWIRPDRNSSRLFTLHFRQLDGPLQTLAAASIVHTVTGVHSSFINFTSDVEFADIKVERGRAVLRVRIKTVKPFQFSEFTCGLRLNSTHELYFTSILLNSSITGIYFLF